MIADVKRLTVFLFMTDLFMIEEVTTGIQTESHAQIVWLSERHCRPDQISIDGFVNLRPLPVTVVGLLGSLFAR